MCSTTDPPPALQTHFLALSPLLSSGFSSHPVTQVSAWRSFLIFPCPSFFPLPTNLIWSQALELLLQVDVFLKNISSFLLLLHRVAQILPRSRRSHCKSQLTGFPAPAFTSPPAHSVEKIAKHEDGPCLRSWRTPAVFRKGPVVFCPLPIPPVIFPHPPKCPQPSPPG